MYFVLLWKTEFVAIWRVALLSQNKSADCKCITWRSCSRISNQEISHVVEIMALYFASVKDMEIVCCFFDFQEIKEFLRKIKNSVTDLLISTQLAQSQSQNASRWRSKIAKILIIIIIISHAQGWLFWFIHVLTQNLNWICNIRSWDG